jgi:hypothetical protein
MGDLPGTYSSSVLDSSASSAQGISDWPPPCEFFATQVLLLLCGGLNGFGAGSRRTRGCCASHRSRLPPIKMLKHSHTKPYRCTQFGAQPTSSGEQVRGENSEGWRLPGASGRSRRVGERPSLNRPRVGGLPITRQQGPGCRSLLKIY